MIAEGFAAIGAKTTLLPGGEVFSALEKGTIEAADYVGPAVNWDLGFQQVTKYIWTGPRGLESIYQPVDLMDFAVNMGVWNKLSPKMKQWVEDEIEVYSRTHFAAIQKADMEAWKKFEDAGTTINRLPVEDLDKFQRVAVPIWFKWANKDKDAAAIFKLQLDIMENPDGRLCRARHVQGPEARSLIARPRHSLDFRSVVPPAGPAASSGGHRRASCARPGLDRTGYSVEKTGTRVSVSPLRVQR